MADETPTSEGMEPTRRLPRGMGDGKTNAQVFGIIGQQVKRIGDLNKTVASGMADVTQAVFDMNDTLLDSNFRSNDLLTSINDGVMDLVKLVDPIAQNALEKMEDQYTPGMAAGTVGAGATSGEALALGESLDKSTPQVEKSTNAFGGLASVIGGAAGGGAGAGIAGLLTGVGIGLGAVGLGLGLITGALYLGAAAVNKFGEGLQNVAEGMDDLNDLEISTEKFDDLGKALGLLVQDLGLGGGLGLMAVAASDFKSLAAGLQDLNDIDVDGENLRIAGEGLGFFLDAVGNNILSGITVQIIDDNLIPLAKGIQAFNDVDVPTDFVPMMQRIGEGLGELLNESGGFLGNNVLQTGALQAIDDNLIPLADGVNRLNSIDVDEDFAERLGTIGLGLNNFIQQAHSMGILLQVQFLQAIDDNLIPLATGIDRLAATDADAFATKAPKLGAGLNDLIAGLDNLFGAIGANTLDDELMTELPLAIDRLNQTDAEKFQSQGTALGIGFGNLVDGFDNFMGTRGLQRISDDLGMFAEGIDDINNLETPDMTKFENIGQGIATILKGVTGEIDNEATGFAGGMQTFFDKMTTGSSTRGLERITGPLIELANAMQMMSNLSDEGMQFDNVALQLTNLLTSVNDKALGDDFDYLYDFTEEITRLQRNVDIEKLGLIADQVERIRGTSDNVQVMEPIPNVSGQQLETGAVMEIMNTTIDNSTQQVVQGGSSVIQNLQNINNKLQMPITPKIFISK